MNALPLGWESRSLSDVCLRAKKSDPVALGRSTIRYIDIGSIDASRHSLTDVPTLEAASAPTRARQIVRTGDTVFSTVRPYLEKIAYVCVDLDDEFAPTGFCVLRPGPRLDARWLFHFSTSRLLLDQVLPHQRGVSYPAVRDNEVLAAEIPLPDIVTQRRIVELLEDHLSRLHASDQGLEMARRRLGQMTISALMVPLGAGVHHPGPRREISFGATHFAIPEAWEPSTVGAMSEVVEYGSGAKAEPEPGIGRVPVLRMGNVKGGALIWDSLKYLPESHPDVARLRLLPGDLLFNRTNSAEHVGKSAVFHGEREATFASYLIRVRFKSAANPQWASRVINSPWGRQFVASVVSQQVGQANVNGTKLRAFPLPVPPRADQDAIVARLEELDDAAVRLGVQLADAKARSATLRCSLLAAAFAGRLT